MKRLILAAALALAACSPAPPASPGGVPAGVDQAVLQGQRGFGAAEVVYTAAAQVVGRMVDHGMITGTTATWVRARNAEARELLIKGKATADAAERARIAARLFAISDSLKALGNALGGGHGHE